VVIGANNKHFGSNSSQGAAYVFSCPTATSCTQASKLTASDGAAYDQFGFSVGVSGSVVVIGAPYKTIGSNSSQGAAFVFSCRVATSCTQASKLTASDGVHHDFFGSAVAISGSLVVVCATVAYSHGTAYTFSCPTATSCVEVSILTVAGVPFANSAAISGSLVVIGAVDVDKAFSYTCESSGHCSCVSGWSGALCSQCAPGYYGGACSGLCSACSSPGTASCLSGISGGCSCDVGWNGTLCDQCATGYYGGACSPAPVPASPDDGTYPFISTSTLIVIVVCAVLGGALILLGGFAIVLYVPRRRTIAVYEQLN
jgi:hypothetical protein